MGHTSAGPGINGTDLVGCVPSSGSSWLKSTLSLLINHRNLWLPSPQDLPSSEGLGLSPSAWGTHFRGMPTGSEAFLGMPGVSELRLCARTNLVCGKADKYRWLISWLIFGSILLRLAVQNFDPVLLFVSSLVNSLRLLYSVFLCVFVSKGCWWWINILSTHSSLCIIHLDRKKDHPVTAMTT